MTNRQARPRITGWTPSMLLAVLLVIGAALGVPLLPSASATAPSSAPAPPSRSIAPSLDVPRVGNGALGEADGILPAGVTAFDEAYPGIANLQPDLLRALREAAARATRHGVEIGVTNGWRSRSYQEQLFRQAVAEYGSEARAAGWVATPGTSAHEAGNAIDVGPLDASGWLSEHGSTYGLCQIYRNEPWHFELRPGAIDRGCPRMYADPTRDPTLQQ